MTLDTLKLETPYLTLDDLFYDINTPTPLEEPYLISLNQEAAKLIDLKIDEENPKLVEWLNTTFVPEGVQFYSMCYSGHQFGHYLPRLGDGRVHNLGTVNGINLQLKGSGETIYSRMADGRTAMRSSIREYLISEALHYLGVPTTRALGIIGSKTSIVRNNIETAAIVMRLSTSWIRFGSFEYFYYIKEYEKLKSLADFVIQESYPHLINDKDRYYKMFCEVLNRTAILIAKWQALGFCHGVMNTDNMSIAGLTIDYGPFAMMDDFKYHYICNHTDRVGRYSYAEQPNISYWNLTMLAKALSPIIEHKRMQSLLDEYGASLYPNTYIKEMSKKLGLQKTLETDTELITGLVVALNDSQVDYTLFFRALSHYNGDRSPLYDIVMDPVIIDNWLKKYDLRLQHETRSHAERQAEMLKTNPKYVLKNYILQEVITGAEQGDFSLVKTWLEIARTPFEEHKNYEKYAEETPEFFKNQGLSCSS